MVDDIGRPKSDHLAKALRVSPQTVRLWNSKDAAPHLAMCTVFWLTQWGQSTLDVDLVNTGRLNAALARCLRDELDTSQRALIEAEALLGASCANMPRYTVPQLPMLHLP